MFVRKDILGRSPLKVGSWSQLNAVYHVSLSENDWFWERLADHRFRESIPIKKPVSLFLRTSCTHMPMETLFLHPVISCSVFWEMLICMTAWSIKWNLVFVISSPKELRCYCLVSFKSQKMKSLLLEIFITFLMSFLRKHPGHAGGEGLG